MSDVVKVLGEDKAQELVTLLLSNDKVVEEKIIQKTTIIEEELAKKMDEPDETLATEKYVDEAIKNITGVDMNDYITKGEADIIISEKVNNIEVSVQYETEDINFDTEY